jgi:16S rRNA (guanine527-N7)-methyltransferase
LPASGRIIANGQQFAAATQVSRETLARLNQYESLLRLWQGNINLVASATLPDLWHRHFYDSAQLLPLLPPGGGHLVDLGSGGGFPGLVLAILLAERPGWRVTLVESDSRKGAFLREVARQTGVAVEIQSARIENPETQSKLGSADVVTARALAPLNRLFGLAEPIFASHSVGLFLKGQNAKAEVEAARAEWVFDASLVPSSTAADASVVVLRALRRK